MTATATLPASDPWTTQLEQLRARYKHVRPPVLAALNILINDQNISVDDAKAQADQRELLVALRNDHDGRLLMQMRAEANCLADKTPLFVGRVGGSTDAGDLARKAESLAIR
jgi:hypothetical protein